MSLLNQFYFDPMLREVQPIDSWNLLSHRRPSMDAEGMLDDVFGDFFDSVPNNNYGGDHANPTNKSDDKFRVQLDVSQFTPDEIKFKVVDRDVVIDGKHEELKDGQEFIGRSFSRKYSLPEDVDEQQVDCQLSKDGKVLKLEAPKKDAIEYIAPQERIIAIEN